jgi:hypothetical protein
MNTKTLALAALVMLAAVATVPGASAAVQAPPRTAECDHSDLYCRVTQVSDTAYYCVVDYNETRCFGDLLG